ncbi:MAG: hypothetical protein U0744_15145 [Gemmataceae bacterium]
MDNRFKLLESDDDGGGNLDSRITFRPRENGVYHIIATTLDGDLGDFNSVKADDKVRPQIPRSPHAFEQDRDEATHPGLSALLLPIPGMSSRTVGLHRLPEAPIRCVVAAMLLLGGGLPIFNDRIIGSGLAGLSAQQDALVRSHPAARCILAAASGENAIVAIVLRE